MQFVISMENVYNNGVCFRSRPKLKARTEPADPPPEPPHYYEVLSADLRYKIYSIIFLAKFDEVLCEIRISHVKEATVGFYSNCNE